MDFGSHGGSEFFCMAVLRAVELNFWPQVWNSVLRRHGCHVFMLWFGTGRLAVLILFNELF
jgi:hypothetical protein